MKPQDVLTIDPVAMNVVNRVSAGSTLEGDCLYHGGLLVQGEVKGSLDVRGCLIVWADGKVSGRVKVWGDLYLFGQLGPQHEADDGGAAPTVVECMGTAYIAATGVSNGTLFSHRIRMYDGAQLNGPFKTLKRSTALPELVEVADLEPPNM